MLVWKMNKSQTTILLSERSLEDLDEVLNIQLKLLHVKKATVYNILDIQLCCVDFLLPSWTNQRRQVKHMILTLAFDFNYLPFSTALILILYGWISPYYFDVYHLLRGFVAVLIGIDLKKIVKNHFIYRWFAFQLNFCYLKLVFVQIFFLWVYFYWNDDFSYFFIIRKVRLFNWEWLVLVHYIVGFLLCF